MARKFWKERYSKGICNFELNYDFFYKWLVSKTASCFYIDGLTETLDDYYIKTNLLIDGDVCITDFNSDLYAVCGAPGGEPSAYYKPTLYTVANPVLGSKIVRDGIDGVIIYNTPIDAYLPGGINGLIVQTATLLADNIVSVNCCQINSRVTAINTADSEAQALAAESVLKSIYAGNPYKIVRSDIIDKIRVNPITQTGAGNVLSELIELHNYIISNYFQAIGIRANNMRKKAHMLQDEIDLQNSYLQISVYEIMSSWQKGFDKVNELYGTDIHVRLNPALLPEIVGGQSETSEDTTQNADPDVNSYIDVSAGAQTDTEQTDTDTDTNDNHAADSSNTDTADTAEQDDNTDTLAENAVDLIEQREEIVEDIIDMINGGNDRMRTMMGRVTTWNNISITDTLLHLAFLNSISNSILTNQYIPVKTATSAGMPDEYTYTKIGMTPEEIADIYETLYGANFLSVKLLKKQFSEDETPYEVSLQQLTRKITNIYKFNKAKYLKIAEALGFAWNPLWNVDGEEKYTSLDNSGVNDEQTTRSYTQHTDTLTDTYGEYTDSTSDSNVRTGSQTTSGSRTETHEDTDSVTTFDSTDFNDTDHNIGSNTTTGDTETTDYNNLTDTGSGSQTHGAHTDTHGTQYGAHTDTDSKTITHKNALNGAAEYSGGVDSFGNVVVGGDHYHTEIRERHGNIGVTKTTELIADAIDLYRTQLLQTFFDDINAQLLVGVYEI